MKSPLNHGLNELPHDPRDIKLGDFVVLPKLSELPAEFELPILSLKDQGDTDFCTGFGTCGASELQEGVELSPEYSFALSKEISGDVDSFGQDVRTAMSVHVKYGALEKSAAPYSLATQDQDFLRRLKNWPADLKNKLSPHQKNSYIFVTGPYDAFDNIRATIWKFRNEKRAVVFGTKWSWPLSQVNIDDAPQDGSGHCMYITGWKKDGRLIAIQSAGPTAGDHGRHYFGRVPINTFVPRYGAGTFIDKSPEEIRYMIDNNIKLGDNWLIQLIKAVVAFIKPINNPPMPQNQPQPQVVTPPTQTPTPSPKTAQQRLYECTVARIGTDASPKDEAPDDLACAETVYNLLKDAAIDVPEKTILSTTDLLAYLLDRPDIFIRVTAPEAGAIVISPSKMGNGKLAHGHTGVFIDTTRIASNNSETGKLLQNYTLDTWAKRYRDIGGFPIYIFKPIGV